MSKKILSVALALIFVISTFAVSAFAVGGTAFEEDGSYEQTWRLEKISEADGTFKVGVYLTTNYKVGAIQFQIANEDGNAVLGDVTSDVFVDGDYDVQFTESGLVFIVPTPTDDSAEAMDLSTETLIATLSYTLAEGASSATIAIADDAKSESNPGGSLIAVRMSDDNLTTGTMIYGQTVVSTGDEVVLGSAAKPELVLKNGVTVNKNYCNTAYTGVIFGFATFGKEDNYRLSVTTTLGDAYIVYEANAEGKHGTGAVLKLVDLDGTVLESYVVVIFGDVNGDGRITTTDTTYLAKNRTTLASSTGADKLAANVNGDNRHSVTTADTTYLAKNRTSLGSMQIDIAATY